MNKLKKFIIIILIICILFPESAYAITQEQAGETIAKFAEDLVNNHSSEFIYSDTDDERASAYKLQKTSGVSSLGVSYQSKYAVDYVGFVSFCIHNSLKIGNKEFTCFVTPKKHAYDPYFEEITPKPDLSNLKRGDIIGNDFPHVMIYLGNGKMANCVTNSSNYPYIQIQDVSTSSGKYNSYGFASRISKSTAESIKADNCNTIFNKVTDESDGHGKYYGTTKGSYAGSYTLGQWLFEKFVGFFDYLAGIITYIFRIQFLGWGNIIEELINYSIKDATGVETVTVDKSEETPEENSAEENSEEGNKYSPGTGNLYTPTATGGTNTVWSNDRINIEDIIYNRVPLLDINFLDVNLDRYKKIEEAKKAQAEEGEEVEVISEDSIVYSLRANIAKWYIVIRQICIIVLLLLLIYLGIRLAISTTAGDKAKYKGMLWAWLASFIVVFCIHYYMMIVIDINEVIVDIFAEASEKAIQNSENGTGSQSIYDTMRTRAYSLKLSEGFPATVFYLVLIYFLVRFLFIYVKRYFTIMILAIMGPIMSIKNCFDKITTGKSKSMSKWMYDFALNVFLQTIHAILYCMFMVIAFDLATNSIAGFIIALIVLNFIFKAEKIFMNIFNFEGRASSLRDVNENKNYFAEAYKVGMGVAMFGGSALKFGAGAVSGTGKFLGIKLLSTPQLGTSIYNRLSWRIQNRRAIRNGQEPIEYTPIDIRERLKDKVDNTKNNISDKLNDFIYDKTGKRSLRLDLHNIKEQDPELYRKTKEALKLKKELKWKTLKRTFGDSTQSIRYMAELMIGVPMLVIDTQSGISTLMDATGGLKSKSERNKGYGYKRKINGRRGNIATTALNMATYGGLNATVNSAEKFSKEHEKIVKNNKLLSDLNKANILELEIQKEVDKMIEDGKKNDVNKIMEDAMKQVMNASKIKEAVSRYMATKGITNITEADLNIIVNKINSEIFAGNVDKVINKYVKKGKVEQLDVNDIEEILNQIGEKVESGVSEVLNDKQNRDVNNTRLKDKINRYMEEQELDKLDIDKVTEFLKSEDAYSDFGIETIEEIQKSIASTFASKKSNEKINKKQAVIAIEDAILAGTVGTKEKQETNLGKMIRELKTLQEKTKFTQGKKVIDLEEFKKAIKEKLK